MMNFAMRQLFASSKRHWPIYGKIGHDQCKIDIDSINDELKTIDCKLTTDLYWRFTLITPHGKCNIRAFAGNCGLFEMSSLFPDLWSDEAVLYWKTIIKLFAVRSNRNLIIYNTEEGQVNLKGFLNKIGFINLDHGSENLKNNNSGHTILFHVLNANKINVNGL
jgi:hypothetical protein